MQNFSIYPKDDNRLELVFESFTLNDATGEIELYDDHNHMFGVLVRQHIAAIVPVEVRPTQRLDMHTFTVYLKTHLDSPFSLNAVGYDRAQGYKFIVDNRPLRWVYIDPAEIVLITYRPTN